MDNAQLSERFNNMIGFGGERFAVGGRRNDGINMGSILLGKRDEGGRLAGNISQTQVTWSY